MDEDKAINYLIDYCQDNGWTEEHSKQRNFSFNEVLELIEGYYEQRQETESV